MVLGIWFVFFQKMSQIRKIKYKYEVSQLKDAIAAVRNGAKIAEAARQYNVPRQTLSNKLKRNEESKFHQ